MHHTYISVPSSHSVGIPGVGVATGGMVVADTVGRVAVGTIGVVGGSVGKAALERIVP